jgi:hypothetical protein
MPDTSGGPLVPPCPTVVGGDLNNDYVKYLTNNTIPTVAPTIGIDTVVLLNGRRFEWDGTIWHELTVASPDKVIYATDSIVPTVAPINGVDTIVLLDGRRFEWDGTIWRELVVPQKKTYEIGQSGPLFDHALAENWAGAVMGKAGNIRLNFVRVVSVHTGGTLTWSLVKKTAANVASVIQTGTLAAGVTFSPTIYGPFAIATGDVIGLLVTTSASLSTGTVGNNLIGEIEWTP